MRPARLASQPPAILVAFSLTAWAYLGIGEAHAHSRTDSSPKTFLVQPSDPVGTPSSSPPASPPPVPASSASPSALPSALPLPSGIPASGAPGTGPAPSSSAMTGHGAPAPAGPDADAPDSASSSPSASPDVSGSTAPLAGREAGAGKARPGRSLSPLEPARAEEPVEEDEPEASLADPVDLPVSTPPPSAFTDPGTRSGHALDAAAVRRVQQVSLGTGIALVGLGLGFLAFRMRRAN